MFLPGSTSTHTNLPITTSNMNNNLHHHHQQQQQQQFLFDSLNHRSNKFSSSSMSRKPSATPNFCLDPDLLRELNARYLHDINTTRSTNGTTSNLDGNTLPAFLLPPFLRAEHYHQHTHTHEHNVNLFTPTTNSTLSTNLNNSLIDKFSKSDNSLSSFLRTTAANNFSPASILPPPLFPPFNLTNNNPSTTTLTNNSTNSTNDNSTKEVSPLPAKKSNKWCAAHVRISWMIYHQQQQRSKDKLSPSENKKEEEQQQSSSINNKLLDLVSTTKQLVPTSSSTSDLSLPFPSTYQSTLPPPPAFNFRSPFEFGGVPNGPFGRVLPSASTAFGGLGSLFPPPPPPPPPPSSSSSTIDRKSDLNGSVAANLNVDWTRFHRGVVPSLNPQLPSVSSNNENLSLKKLDESNNNNNNNNERKRSSTVVNNEESPRHSHHHHHHPSHLMVPPSHLPNRSRSRSPHPSLHHHHSSSSSSLVNKNSSPPLSSSSSRKRNSPTVKSSVSDNCKHSSHVQSSSLPPPFAALDPLTLSIIERQRLSAAYASLFVGQNASPPVNYFPSNLDPTTLRSNGSSSHFPNVDPSSAMAVALIQREHFLNSLRLSQQQQHEQTFERERERLIATNTFSMNKTLKNVVTKSEEMCPKVFEDSSIISPKVATSPGSHSSTSSSSRSSSSKKCRHVKRVKPSSSPTSLSLSTENQEMTLKRESTPSISITT